MKSSEKQTQLRWAFGGKSEKQRERRRGGLSVQRILGNLLSCEPACTSNFFVGGNVASSLLDACTWRAFNRQHLFDQLCRYQRQQTFLNRRTRDHSCVDDQ